MPILILYQLLKILIIIMIHTIKDTIHFNAKAIKNNYLLITVNLIIINI